MTDEFKAHDTAHDRSRADGRRGSSGRDCQDLPGLGRAASLRATWHAYHLIGDVLRSADLACHPDHDAAVCAACARG